MQYPATELYQGVYYYTGALLRWTHMTSTAAVARKV